MARVSYGNIKEFLFVVRKIELQEGAKVILDNDNNTVVATIEGVNVAQWFANYGTIEKNLVDKVLNKSSNNKGN